jgi:hypothetical protein
MTDSRDREKILALAYNLHEAAMAGKISWTLTDDEDKFLYAGTRSSVTIEEFSDRYFSNRIALCLLNSEGTIVDSIRSELVTDESGAEVPAPWNQKLDELFYTARRVAHKADEALESMLADIERGTPSPPVAKPKKPADDPWASKPKKPADDPWASDASGDTGFTDEPPF